MIQPLQTRHLHSINPSILVLREAAKLDTENMDYSIQPLSRLAPQWKRREDDRTGERELNQLKETLLTPVC